MEMKNWCENIFKNVESIWPRCIVEQCIVAVATGTAGGEEPGAERDERRVRH